MDTSCNHKDLLHCGIAVADEMSWSVRDCLARRLTRMIWRLVIEHFSTHVSIYASVWVSIQVSIDPADVAEYPSRFLSLLSTICVT